MKKIKLSKDIESWEEEFIIGPFTYQILSQLLDRDEYAVRVYNEYHEWEWLKHPESRFETLSGARYAILMDIETRVSKYIKLPKE